MAKSYKDILWAVKHKINYFTIDDEASLNNLIEVAIKYKLSKIKINVRLNVYECFRDKFESNKILDSRLGAYIVNAIKLFRIINAENRIKIEKGISFYIQYEMQKKENRLIIMLDYLTKIFSKSVGIDFIDIGGGFDEKLLTKSKSSIAKTCKYFDAQYIVLEPGRFMVGDVEDAYVPCTRIVNNLEISNEVIASLELGIYNGLNDIVLHNRIFEFYVCDNDKLIKLEKFKPNKKKLVLRGPTADSLDVLGVFSLPNCNIGVDSIFVIKNIGAYVEVFDSNFSGETITQTVKILH